MIATIKKVHTYSYVLSVVHSQRIQGVGVSLTLGCLRYTQDVRGGTTAAHFGSLRWGFIRQGEPFPFPVASPSAIAV
jgi:hypothetical protein